MSTEMVAAGLASVEPHYKTNRSLPARQEQARQEHKGLSALADAVPPSTWRHEHQHQHQHQHQQDTLWQRATRWLSQTW